MIFGKFLSKHCGFFAFDSDFREVCFIFYLFIYLSILKPNFIDTTQSFL